MYLAGLQKLTLLDYPEHVACTVFTAGCNLRCPFCHNSDLVLPSRRPERLDEADFFAFLKKRRGIASPAESPCSKATSAPSSAPSKTWVTR